MRKPKQNLIAAMLSNAAISYKMDGNIGITIFSPLSEEMEEKLLNYGSIDYICGIARLTFYS